MPTAWASNAQTMEHIEKLPFFHGKRHTIGAGRSAARDVEFLGIVVERHITIAIIGKEFLHVRLLFRHELALTELEAIILALASEQGNHSRTEFGSILHPHITEQIVKSPCHANHTQGRPKRTCLLREDFREDCLTPLLGLTPSEITKIVNTFAALGTLPLKAEQDLLGGVPLVKSLF